MMNNEVKKDIDPAKAAARSGQYRVMVVDDSAVIRGLISKWLNKDPSITVVGTASNGQMAIHSLDRYDPEIVVLDIEMPVMDGLEALPIILKLKPDLQVLMASTLTKRNAEISMRALTLGAADYVPKPETNRGVITSETFQNDLISKVINLAATRRRQLGGAVFAPMAASILADDLRPHERKITLNSMRRPVKGMPSILAIGSSTGGPQALMVFFSGLKKSDVKVPIVVTQHMPPSFTAILANHLSSATDFDVIEGAEGMELENGKVYIAPGDYHMTIKKSVKGGYMIALNQDEKENFCRPSVDVMMRSVIKEYGSGTLSVIFTGMGQDGLKGCTELIERGGNVIAQDENTSIVWGMPGAVSEAGLCCAILPLDRISARVNKFMTGGA